MSNKSKSSFSFIYSCIHVLSTLINVCAMLLQENREVSFWFKDGVAAETREGEAKQYFKELLKPEGFPKGTKLYS